MTMRKLILVLFAQFYIPLASCRIDHFHESIPLFDWNELERDLKHVMSTNCHTRRQDLCLKSSSNRQLCRCDEDCLEFGDCCFDFTRQQIQNRRAPFNDPVKCQWNTDVFVDTVDSCPRSYPDPTIVSKCAKSQLNGETSSENEQDTSYTYMDDLPVTSRVTNRNYANIFCAICNGEQDNLRSYNATIRCDHMNIIEGCGLDLRRDIMRNEFYVMGDLRWTRHLAAEDPQNNCTGGSGYFISCYLVVDKDDPRRSHKKDEDMGVTVLTDDVGEKLESPNTRPCLSPGAVDSCDLTTSRPSTFDLKADIFCKLYAFLVVHDGKVYKNPHCALCHGIPINRTKCASTEEISHHRERTSGLDSPRSWLRPNLPISFDFTPIRHSELNLEPMEDVARPLGPDFPGQFRKRACHNDQIWDNIQSKCYNVKCGYLYANIGGECQRRNITLEDTTMNFDDEDECFVQTLNPWEIRQTYQPRLKATLTG